MTQATTAAHAACRRLDHVEVVGVRELDELDLVARRPRRRRVVAALLRRDDVVPPAVDEQLRHAEREQRGGRRGGVALGHLVGPAAEEALTGAVAQIRSRSPGEVGDARERDRSDRPDAAARREPESEVPSRGVPGGDDPARVDLLQRADVVERGGHVLERPRPASSLLPDPPVLDIPGGEAAPREVVRERRHQRPVPAPAPEPAVQQDHDREGAGTVGQMQVPDLVGMIAVGDLARRRQLVALSHLEPYASSARRRDRASRSVSMSASVL